MKLRMKYQYDPNRWGNPYHQWSIESELGACHLHLTFSGAENDPPCFGGIELHYRSAPEHERGNPPDHHNCPFVGGNCWHEGSSMAAESPGRMLAADGGRVDNHDYYFAEVRSFMERNGLLGETEGSDDE